MNRYSFAFAGLTLFAVVLALETSAQTLTRTFNGGRARVQYVRLTPTGAGEITAEACVTVPTDDGALDDTRCEAFELTGARLVQARNLAQSLRDNVLKGRGFAVDAGAL